jgi:hypothetical protein
MRDKTTVPDVPLQIALGKDETLIGELEFTFIVNTSGDAHVQVSATNVGKGSALLMLDANGYEQLKAIIKNADGMIDRIIGAGRIKRMVLPC